MNTSEQIDQIAAALVVAQAEMPAAQMNATNPFLKNRYADLNSITAALRDTLARHGLSYVQMPSLVDGGTFGIALTTRIMHTSGQWIEDTFVMPMPAEERGKSMMQVAGSAISYARRYALAAAFGVVADEDADGNAAEPPPRTKKQRPAAQKPAQKQAPPPMAASNGKAERKTKPFYLTASERIPYYGSPEHAEKAAGLLGLPYPHSKDAAAAQLIRLEHYAELRADGVPEAEAVVAANALGSEPAQGELIPPADTTYHEAS